LLKGYGRFVHTFLCLNGEEGVVTQFLKIDQKSGSKIIQINKLTINVYDTGRTMDEKI
jgi:hypothetical protein